MIQWNIANLSVNGKTRWPAVCAWLRSTRPDIVTLQKIGRNEHFPAPDLCDIGYVIETLPWRSQSDRGVAVLTLCDLRKQEVCAPQLSRVEPDASRFLSVRVDDLWVSSVYAPFGPPPGDSRDSEPPYKRAIARRVAWLNALRDHVRKEGYGCGDALLCGDFNVKVAADGPIEMSDRFYSSREQDVLEEILDLGFVDAYRTLYPDRRKHPGRTFGYGHHRRPGGTSRLHLILASKRLEKGLQDAWVEPNAIPGKPSVPLLVALNRVRE